MSLSKYLSLPSSPASDHSQSPSFSPSSTSLNGSPFVESPPSSPGHKPDFDQCPANNEPPSPYVLPELPFFDIRPSPKELETCRPVVFGYPIPDEWFPHRYQLKKATEVELESYGKECAMAFDQLGDICEEVCDEMWPEGWGDVYGTRVWCLRNGETTICRLLQIGTATSSPSFDVTMEMEGRLAEYGVREMPGWYPECGKLLSLTRTFFPLLVPYFKAQLNQQSMPH